MLSCCYRLIPLSVFWGRIVCILLSFQQCNRRYVCHLCRDWWTRYGEWDARDRSAEWINCIGKFLVYNPLESSPSFPVVPRQLLSMSRHFPCHHLPPNPSKKGSVGGRPQQPQQITWTESWHNRMKNTDIPISPTNLYCQYWEIKMSGFHSMPRKKNLIHEIYPILNFVSRNGHSHLSGFVYESDAFDGNVYYYFLLVFLLLLVVLHRCLLIVVKRIQYLNQERQNRILS